jgi:hypothetical protein
MAPKRRAAEQVGFGASQIGEAQAEAAALDDDMIDDGGGDSAAPEEIVRGFMVSVFNGGRLDSIEELISPQANAVRTRGDPRHCATPASRATT